VHAREGGGVPARKGGGGVPAREGGGGVSKRESGREEEEIQRVAKMLFDMMQS